MKSRDYFSHRRRRRVAAFIWLFQRGALPEELIEEELRLEDEDAAFGRIRCPLCQWQPDSMSFWECGDCDYPEYFFAGCGTSWNTFTTRGRCPGCGYQWHWTACLRCDGWSPHEDWYTEAD